MLPNPSLAAGETELSNPNWENIVKSNSRGVVSAALRVLGTSADAEDVAQEVFLEAYRKWRSGDGQAWPGLLRRMSVLRALDLLRTRKGNLPLSFQPVDAQCNDPSAELIQNETHERLRQSVSRLPVREAEVFCLACFEQLENGQIAEELGITKAAVATALCKAKTRLTEMFQLTSGDAK